MKNARVCVLAYNEQKHIAETVRAILAGNDGLNVEVIVYANGCTDETVDVVEELSETTPNLRLRELAKASKPHAWNTAFGENSDSILFFSDGDVRPEPGSVAALHRHFDERPELSLVCSKYSPNARGLSFSHHLTGFLQKPLCQDYHAGGFYAVRRTHLARLFEEKGLDGIPEGIVADDTFLEMLVPREAFLVAGERVFCEPPAFGDFLRVVARIRWQEEQLQTEYGDLFGDRMEGEGMSLTGRLARKLGGGQGIGRTLLGVTSAGLRTIVQMVFKGRIDRCYRELGPVCREGRGILAQATRSASAK